MLARLVRRRSRRRVAGHGSACRSRFLLGAPGQVRLVGLLRGLGLQLVEQRPQPRPTPAPARPAPVRSPSVRSRYGPLRVLGGVRGGGLGQNLVRRSARRSGSPPRRRWRPAWCRRSRPGPGAAAQRGRTPPAPGRTGPRSRSRGWPGTGRSWRGRAAGSPRPPGTPRPRPVAARSGGWTAHRRSRRRPAPRASSAGRTPLRPGHRAGTRHRTPTGRARRPHPARTTPGDPRGNQSATDGGISSSCSRSTGHEVVGHTQVSRTDTRPHWTKR